MTTDEREDVMPSRVIYCALGCAATLAQLSHENLQRLDEGVVVSVSDEIAGTLHSKFPAAAVGLLFFSVDDFREAVRGLSESDAAQAIAKRRAEWSPRLPDAATGRLLDDYKRVLAAGAAVSEQATGPRKERLSRHFRQDLDFVASIAGSGRFDQMDPPDLLSAIAETEALLLEELERAPAAPSRDAEVAQRKHLQKGLFAELTQLGRPEFVQAPPYAEPERGVWITPLDEQLRRSLKATWTAWREWRGGALALLRLSQVEATKRGGKRVEVFYTNPGQLRQDMELTDAQLSLRAQDLAGSAGNVSRDRQSAEYRNALRLELAIMLNAAVRHRPALESRKTAEYAMLAADLGRTDVWRRAGDRGDRATLERAHQATAQDALLLGTLAQSRGNPSVAGRMKEVAQRVAQDLHSIAALFQ